MSVEPCNDSHGGFFCAKPAAHDGEHESCGGRRWGWVGGMTPRERAFQAAMDADGRHQEAEAREYVRELVDAALDAVGYYALVAERDRLALEAKSLRERRDAADRVHADTMRGWATTVGEFDAVVADRDRLTKILGEAEGMLAEYHESIGRYVPDGIATLVAERDRLIDPDDIEAVAKAAEKWGPPPEGVQWRTLLAELDRYEQALADAVDEIEQLEAVVTEARNVLDAYDEADPMADWTGAMVDTRLRSAVAALDRDRS